MLTLSSARKNKICLEDYDYESDMHNRLLMAELSVFDVEVLEEILISSLNVDMGQLAAILEADISDIIEVVDRLLPTKLFTRSGTTLHVDKENRKYFESQIARFDKRFRPSVDFLQGLLTKVPIHVLPNWYSISRTSTNIFESIIDKYLRTPRVYRRYLIELGYGDPIVTGIMEDAFAPPEFKCLARDLREKYNLSREEFQEYMLHLEFNFICCLSYTQVGDQWHEVVTPFAEWRDYLRFHRDTLPKPLPESPLQPLRSTEFAFASDAQIILNVIGSTQVSAKALDESPWFTVDQTVIQQIASQCENMAASADNIEILAEYFGWILRKLVLLQLVSLKEDVFVLLPVAAEWRIMTHQEFALNIYRHPANRFVTIDLQHHPKTERYLREVEKALSRAAGKGWVLLDDFIRGATASVRGAEEVMLTQVGRKWTYVRPTYTTEQAAFIKGTILERFFEAGYVQRGVYKGKESFTVTPFGKSVLSLA